MVINILSFIVKRKNELITNLHTIERVDSPLIDLFYRIIKIFVIKLKQLKVEKFYLPQLNE